MRSAFFRKYLLPGFVFQSVVIGGGYGTGRELVEFFLSDGPVSGLLAMGVATAIWCVVLALSFELARMAGTYDYRTFLDRLLGRGWIAYEVVYLAGLVLIVSVLGSAAGIVLNSMLGWPPIAGIALMAAAVSWLAFSGTGLIERVMSVWSFALYAVYGLVAVLTLARFGPAVQAALGEAGGSSWLLNGARYAAYNVGIMPAILFAARHIETRREAFWSGGLAGVIAMGPGLFVYMAMLAHWPEVVAEPIPSDTLLARLDLPALRFAFQVVLFGTFVETGVGVIHGFNERLSGVLEERGRQFTHKMRLGTALALLALSIFVADRVGIVALIASGYGTLTWGYWLVFVLPVLTIGLARIVRAR